MSCQGTTKTGKPCKSTGVLDNGFCMAHQPENSRDFQRFGGSQPGAGRPRQPKAVEVLREALEARADEIVAPLWEALTADRAVVVGNGPTAHVELVPDIPTRMAATRMFIEHGFGKPKQAIEHSGPEGDAIPVEIRIPDTDEYRRKVIELAAKVTAVDASGH